ncbi:SIR2 family protein [Adhaeribacter sp. BT258]|uniref:SIR2 family protein n=1 Tax=Adhaeribacter terrigena TaxID=2793070 RepID=A0ABS1C0B5_9BACT|nr:SIR2 family protein [Adhaeribacter terrigena]MBK0402780.1 SIR2 family protein [Adhaeribacter terrigena]
MNFDSTYIKNIIKANNDNSLAIFIGAGISKSSETKFFKLPSWNDLIVDLKKELSLNDETDYLKIAQLYYLAFDEYTYYKKLKTYFPDYIKPSEIHKLIFEVNPHVIITTNWDTILEKTIEENAFIFDVICSDVDLVKSSLQNKLLKIHGDFRNHNIVFKEDDYINYKYNFPLIENYVKSILSTHTVLFLGYSYNDINLKHILKWIQNNSKVRPPMYLATFFQNPTQSKYLANHGITTLVLNDNDKLISDFDDYSNKTYTFLNKIKNYDKAFIINSKEDTVDFILDKLNVLKDLEGILIDQIQKVLTNCSFVYDDDKKPILEFHKHSSTGDSNANIRAIYQKFVQILVDIDEGEKPSLNILKIFEILGRANIKGIIISESEEAPYEQSFIKFSDYLEIANPESELIYFNFDFKDLTKNKNEIRELLELAFKFYQLEKNEEAFGLMEEIILLCLKHRNYTLLFIAMFNRNTLLRRLKFNFSLDNNRYLFTEEYNLKERYYNLPKDLRLILEPIYNFIDKSFIYQYAFKISEELRKTEDSGKTIKSGGLVLNSNYNEFTSNHENFVFFVLRNKIMIENYQEFRKINSYFIKISILRQIQKETVSLNKLEIYSCIKYIDYKGLKVLLEEFYHNDSERKGHFMLSDESKDWLIDIVFENIVEQFIKSEITFNKFENYFKNLIFLLSLTPLEEEEISNVLTKINKIISNGNNTLGIFQAINLFFGLQYNLFKTNINEQILLILIENLISKLLNNKINFQEFHAITNNEIYNIYGYAKERKALFTNDRIINKLLNEIKEYPISDIIDVCQKLLISIFNISNGKIKDLIKSFLLKVDTTEENQLHKRISFELSLIIYDFKGFDKNILVLIDEYLDQFGKTISFSSALYALDSQIDYLIKNKDISELKVYSKVIKALIERHQKSESLSIF